MSGHGDDISEKVAELVKEHVSKDWGMTNDMVNDIAMALCPNLYKGLYMPEHLLRISMAGNILQQQQQQPFTMIINVGKHFVTVVSHEKYVLYLDPFGIPCMQPQVRQFLRGLHSKIFYNKTQIQQLKSKHCGLYAVLFALYYDVPARSTRLKFDENASEKNDKLCTVYLHKLNKETL